MYQTNDYSYIKGTPGFSDKILDMHFKLYDGYVKNTNKILESLKNLQQEGKVSSPEFAELKRRLGWEFDGMRLHEYYFPQIGGDGKMDEGGKLAKAIKDSFGSYDAWADDFVATGMMRGIGWAALYEDVHSGRLINFWINEHNQNHPAGGNLILVADVFEHAYVPDYGADRASYIEAFMKSLRWDVIEKRLR